SAQDHFRKNFCAVSDEPYRKSTTIVAGDSDEFPSFLEVVGHPVEITGFNAALNMRGIHLNSEKRGTIHRCGQWLGAAHSAQAARQENSSFKRPTEVLPAGGGECLIRPLDDSLRPDVNPAARRHLPVHRELKSFKAIEFVARCPMRHK